MIFRNKIPKIIHYCWFGGKPIPPASQEFIDSWKEKCPDYTFMRWDESSFDVDKYNYTKQAFERGKWAFISDVCRFEKLYEFGGIYLDINTSVRKPFNELLRHDMFVGFEQDNLIQMGVFGAKKHHRLTRAMIDRYYSVENLLDDMGKINYRTVNDRMQELLLGSGMEARDSLQVLTDVTVYPKEYFCPRYWNSNKQDPVGKNTYTVHYFGASWHSPEDKKLREEEAKKHARQALVSIVVPVYNVEKYIDDCVCSIQRQSHKEVEIILVDDGSTDHSGEKCDIWAKKDKRIRVVHKKNEGLNSARRDGFRHATGAYITFIDSDDMVADNFVEILLAKLREHSADVAITGFEEFAEAPGHWSCVQDDIEAVFAPDKRRVLGWLIEWDMPWSGNLYIMTAWGKLYTRQVIEKIDWDFSNYRANEDEFWTMQAFNNLEHGAVLTKTTLYKYRKNPNSITQKTYKNYIDGRRINKFQFIEFLYKESLDYLGPEFDGMLLRRLGANTVDFVDMYIDRGVMDIVSAISAQHIVLRYGRRLLGHAGDNRVRAKVKKMLKLSVFGYIIRRKIDPTYTDDRV